MIMGLLRAIADRIFGRRATLARLEAQAEELREARKELRTSVNGLGQEVWGMVETGDPLAALVHGARASQFHRDIKEGGNGK